MDDIFEFLSEMCYDSSEDVECSRSGKEAILHFFLHFFSIGRTNCPCFLGGCVCFFGEGARNFWEGEPVLSGGCPYFLGRCQCFLGGLPVLSRIS